MLDRARHSYHNKKKIAKIRLVHHKIFFSVILRNITVPAAILRNITQTYANSRNITQYYAILRKFTHVNSCKTYVFKSLRKFTQCKLTQTYANLRNITVPAAILRNITLITQTYAILR